MCNIVNEDDRYSFAHRTLQMIDNEHNNDFHAHDKKSYCTKSAPIATALHWNGMVEAANLRISQ